MGRLQKISKERQAELFEAMVKPHVPLAQHQPEMKKRAEEAQRDRSWETDSVAPKLSHSTPDQLDLIRGGHSIRSARCAPDGITNIGGSGKMIGASRNSVADRAILDMAAKALSSRERTTEEKKAAQNIRAMKQSEYVASHKPRIGDDAASYLSRKGNSVASAGGQMSSRYTPAVGKISIFDNADHERVKALPGETMEKREAKKDDSWQSFSKPKTTREAGSQMFDNLAQAAQKSGYKNQQRNSVDRLFESIINKKKS